MITKQKLCILSAVLCMAGVFLQPSGMITDKAGAAATVTIGYYNDVPEFQSGASDDERKSYAATFHAPPTRFYPG